MNLRNTLRLPAPAKLNLFLHVTGRRDDGYHTLESLLVPIDHGDHLLAELGRHGRRVCPVTVRF